MTFQLKFQVRIFLNGKVDIAGQIKYNFFKLQKLAGSIPN